MNCKKRTLYMPNFFCSYLTYYAKITTDPTVYKDNYNYNGVSSLIPHPSKEGDYVTSKQLNFNKTSKIFKIHKIINHEVVLLNFNDEPINKDIFEERVIEYKNKEQQNEYNDSSCDGGSSHMNGPMHKLMKTYGKDIPYITMEQILEEKTLINNIQNKNL
jgi:hypothetical protein